MALPKIDDVKENLGRMAQGFQVSNPEKWIAAGLFSILADMPRLYQHIADIKKHLGI